MAKVGLENDTLKQPKCPSNWEYSTGQRQLLDIQSGEQMDRLSFSAQRTEDSIKLSFFCAFRGRVRDHIDKPSKPPFDKGGFAWSGKRATKQIYARIVDQTVSREMDKLSAALSGTSFSLNGGESSTKEIAN